MRLFHYPDGRNSLTSVYVKWELGCWQHLHMYLAFITIFWRFLHETVTHSSTGSLRFVYYFLIPVNLCKIWRWQSDPATTVFTHSFRLTRLSLRSFNLTHKHSERERDMQRLWQYCLDTHYKRRVFSLSSGTDFKVFHTKACWFCLIVISHHLY